MNGRRRVFVSLGSNLGDRERHLRRAVRAIGALPGSRVLAVSRIYQTAPRDREDQPSFLNQVVCVETGLSPPELLAALQDIEAAEGRTRTVRYGPRTLDLDILLVEGYRSATERLTVPHPRLWERAFVLVPLAELWWLARGMPERDVGALGRSLAAEQQVEVYVGTGGQGTDDRAALREELHRLAAERDAVILAHNYQVGEVQDAADHVGDSLELARTAAATDASVILFCGVHFMAETAAILSPDKTVLLPVEGAGCPMANMVTPEALRDLRRQHPGAAVVAYINTSAAVKAETDVCCTSANAVEIVARFPDDQPIIFVPDRNLGDWVNRRLGRQMILWDGYCHVHDAVSATDIEALRNEHPGARVMAHPECRREVLDLADAVLSTSGMLKLPAEDEADEFIVATETGLLHRLGQLYPDRRFYPVTASTVCPDMKLTTLESAVAALRDCAPKVTVSPHIRERALLAVRRMVEG